MIGRIFDRRSPMERALDEALAKRAAARPAYTEAAKRAAAERIHRAYANDRLLREMVRF